MNPKNPETSSKNSMNNMTARLALLDTTTLRTSCELVWHIPSCGLETSPEAARVDALKIPEHPGKRRSKKYSGVR